MDRYTRKDAVAAFERLVKAVGGRVANDYKDVGAYRLDWNATYGGGNIERIVGETGGVSQPFGAGRMNAKDFCNTVHFTMNALAERDRLPPGEMLVDTKLFNDTIADRKQLLDALQLARKYVVKMVADNVNTVVPPANALRVIDAAIANTKA